MKTWGLEPPAARVNVLTHIGSWPTAIKLYLLWKTEVSKNAWIKRPEIEGRYFKLHGSCCALLFYTPINATVLVTIFPSFYILMIIQKLETLFNYWHKQRLKYKYFNISIFQIQILLSMLLCIKVTVRMPYLSSNIPSSIFYGSIFLEFLQIARCELWQIYIYIYLFLLSLLLLLLSS